METDYKLVGQGAFEALASSLSRTQVIDDTKAFREYVFEISKMHKQQLDRLDTAVATTGAAMVRIETKMERIPEIINKLDRIDREGPTACILHRQEIMKKTEDWGNFLGSVGNSKWRATGLAAVLIAIVVCVILFEIGPKLLK